MTLPSFGPREENPIRRRKRVTPVKSHADAAAQAFRAYNEALKYLGDAPVTPADAFYLTNALKNLVDLKLTQALSDSVIDAIERRLTELEDKVAASELLK